MANKKQPASGRFTARDAEEFAAGRHHRVWRKLGAHRGRRGEREGVFFSVWAPSARAVSVVGSFNDWEPESNALRPVGESGVFGGFVEGVPRGALYKFHIRSKLDGYRVDKADPFALRSELPPATASVVWDLDYRWGDADWMKRRRGHDPDHEPMSIYELHLGSWRRRDGGAMLDYSALADELVPYVESMGYTHVELLPPMEHPFYGSWGYQTTGYFAPSSRYGSPQQLMELIDRLHQAGIGVVLDWVPSHFPGDEHGLAFFDGTHLFEHADPRLGFHPDWNSYIFDYGRGEVRSFLISSALFWIENYHADALRVDAVASMLYRDYSRAEGEWIPNRHGGRENLEAIDFLRRLNAAVHDAAPGVTTIAEESTAWPMVSRPEHLGGLGFDMKWDMGWMHDTLEYMRHDPVYRKFHHDALTFRPTYAFSERFVLPLSHDEVVHGKRSLAGKMFGDPWQKLANLRLLLGYAYAQPGKKLMFMGGELGQWHEWDHDGVLDWQLLESPLHAGLKRWVADLNRLYREEVALHDLDFDGRGFRWVDCRDADQSVLCFTRHGRERADRILIVCNFTPVARHNYRVGVDSAGRWRELLNSDAAVYGGGGEGNLGSLEALPIRFHDRDFSLSLTAPGLSVLFFKPARPLEPLRLTATAPRRDRERR